MKEPKFYFVRFARNLWEKREKSGYSMRALAKKIKVSAATICRIENLEVIPDLLTYVKCCRWLHLPIGYYFKTLKHKK